jgi:hypothetical protein
MGPNNNQPYQPGQDNTGQPPVPRQLPDWQQGLGGMPVSPQPVPPAPSTPGPQPGELPTPTPANMPAQQPGVWSPPPMPSPLTPPTPAMGTGMPPSETSGTKRRLTAVILVILVLLAIGGAAYFILSSGKSTDNAADKSTKSSNSQAASMAALSHATLNPPDNIPGYKARQTGIASIKDYVSDDNVCEFIIGTTTVAQLPGVDLDAIVKPQLDQLRSLGATVNGPTAGPPLTLKNADDSSKQYSMPTLNFEFSQDKKHAIVHYSAVILSSGDRAVINRTCINQNGEVDKAKLSALDEKAKGVTVLSQ